MSPLVYRMHGILSRVVQRVPVGTHRGLLYFLWMLLSNRLLLSRGAVIPGLATEAVRRAWAAVAYGQWHATQLLEAWEQLVREQKPTVSLDVISLMASSCGYYRGQIEPRAAQ